MSSQLRRDQLRRCEAGSRVWQEVTVGETGALVTEQRLHQKCPAVLTPLPPHSAGSHRRHNGRELFPLDAGEETGARRVQRGSDGFMNKTSGEEEGMDGKEGMHGV